MISSEYGWGDETIGDLFFDRFAQIVATIRTRMFHQNRSKDLRTSWMVRNITSYIAQGYMTDGKEENKALTNALSLSLDPTEAAFLSGVTQGGSTGPEVAWEPGMPAHVADSDLPSFDKVFSTFSRG